MKIKRALLSVSDKRGLTDFARRLAAAGVELISTGGTFKALVDAGIPAKQASEVTKFPEMMDGRVKTLHPAIHGGILAIRDKKEHCDQLAAQGIEPIDMVVVNLYPFEETIAKPGITQAEAIEMIDIGGPSMLRSAAKNNAYVTLVVDPDDYESIAEAVEKCGEVDRDTRWRLAKKGFAHTAAYDAAIATYFAQEEGEGSLPQSLRLAFEKTADLRYGENPHQQAALYRDPQDGSGVAYGKQLHGKELSYNNYVDMDSAWRMVTSFSEPACVIVKHTNPCGAALGANVKEAYMTALAADPVSAFGGIVAVNDEIDGETAAVMKSLFIEVLMAPAFTEEALAILKEKKNIRLITLTAPAQDGYEITRISGGLLLQTADTVEEDESTFRVVTKAQPSAEEWEELMFAWTMVKHVKSNAIVVTKGKQTIGVGAGQMNRVGAAKIAFAQAGDKCEGAVLASDAFLPFGDTVEAAAEQGITAIIQPGGSVRDQESIDAADRAGIAMIFTGCRHFKH